MVKIDCDKDHVLIKAGKTALGEIRHTHVTPEQASLYEEVTNEEFEAMRREEEHRKEYSRRLSAAVHERYSMDDEIALKANLDDPELLDDEAKAESVAAEWAEYQAYRKECKARVREEMMTEEQTEEQKEGERTEGVLRQENSRTGELRVWG